MGLTAILALINAAIPAVTNLIVLLKNEDGTVTAIVTSAQAATAADIQAMQAWLAAHPSTPAAPAA
jgi:hypothetical protein